MVGSRRFSLLLFSTAALLLAAAPARALDPAALTEMETLLRDLGFDPGPVDGIVDADTTEAIRRYKDFAVAPGAPEPSAALLDELRGVAAAFAALNAAKVKPATADTMPPPLPVPLPDLGAGPEETPAPELVAEKVIVPPPPAPPKLKPLDAAPVPVEPQDQVAALPPPDAEAAPEAGPSAEAQGRIDAELAPYRQELDSGSLTTAALAKRFNDEGRKLLQAAQYDDAIVKFSVAIFLDPGFAGAYSNRGTAYQRGAQSERAKADFDKAKALGFGGFRLRDGSNPLN
ncbi:peptidoglycan-binding protein [Pelagibius sp. 7325]|uniref:peptidoglycan-binding protein n=1 Tax=Pelagibius sp. 7325 TaxID=3131994 RepID=UPI0030EF8281